MHKMKMSCSAVNRKAQTQLQKCNTIQYKPLKASGRGWVRGKRKKRSQQDVRRIKNDSSGYGMNPLEVSEREFERRVIEDYSLLSPLTGFIKKLPQDKARVANKRLRTIYRTSLMQGRNAVLTRFFNELVLQTQPIITKLFRRMGDNGAWRRLQQEAVNAYRSVYRKDNSEKANWKAYMHFLKTNATTQAAVRRELQEALRQNNDSFQGVLDTLPVAFAAWHYTAARAMSHALRGQKLIATEQAITDAYIYAVQAATSARAKAGMSALDKILIEIIQKVFPIVADTIAARANMITLDGFTDAMFETVRESLNAGFFGDPRGALGAEALADQIGAALLDKYGAKLPEEVEDRLMLWARTEGCVVQNDALMEIGRETGMDGKQWITVGDDRVRDAHVDNEADGVIPVEEEFSDGSMDGGSGSMSPFNCRCEVGPALLDGTKSLARALERAAGIMEEE